MLYEEKNAKEQKCLSSILFSTKKGNCKASHIQPPAKWVKKLKSPVFIGSCTEHKRRQHITKIKKNKQTNKQKQQNA